MNKIKSVFKEHKRACLISLFIVLVVIGIGSYFLYIRIQAKQLEHNLNVVKQEYDDFKQHQEQYKDYLEGLNCEDEQHYLEAYKSNDDVNAKIYFDRYKECFDTFLTDAFAKKQSEFKDRYDRLEINIDDYENDDEKEKIKILKHEIETLLAKQKDNLIIDDIEQLANKLNEFDQLTQNAKKKVRIKKEVVNKKEYKKKEQNNISGRPNNVDFDISYEKDCETLPGTPDCIEGIRIR